MSNDGVEEKIKRGCCLYLFTAPKLAAQAIQASLRQPWGTRWRWWRYERTTFKALKFYWEMGTQFYTQPFFELLLEPRHRLDIPAAVNAALAGELSGRWAIRWRMRVLFWLVRLHARRPLVPRIRFE